MCTTSNVSEDAIHSEIHRLMPELMQLVDEIAEMADSGFLPHYGPAVNVYTQEWAAEWRRKILTPGRNND